MEYPVINGKKTAIVNILVDPQKGFHQLGLSDTHGGLLYVPGGEEVVAPIGKLVSESRNSLFIVSNDWHPKNHIADMSNHPGVVEYRKSLLSKAGKNPEAYMNPLELGFSELVLDKNGDIIGVMAEDRKHIRAVDVRTNDGKAPNEEDRGRVVKVHEQMLDQTFDQLVGASTQTLWTPHCVQGTESARMPDGLNLPKQLIGELDNNLTKLVFRHDDKESGNRFYVVRKGTSSERDSNGLLVENDRTTTTAAEGLLKDLAKEFRNEGVKHVVFNYMGLATNFCVEFSANQVAAIADGYFDIAGMSTEHLLVQEACRGIPIPGGKDDPFSLNGTFPRLAEKYGFGSAAIDTILAVQQPGQSTSGTLQLAGGLDQKKVVS